MKYLEMLMMMVIIYGLTLSIKWGYDSNVIVKELLTDILTYDLQIIEEYESFMKSGNIMEAREVSKLFISADHITIRTWFENWNPFNWGEAKYIKMPARHILLKRLNHWRNTGEYLYNIKESNVKSI